MIKVTLIGTGNVASHLNAVFTKSDEISEIEMISSRGDLSAKLERKINKNGESDIYIIAVADDVIASVSQSLKNTNKIIAHTSGSVAMDVLPLGHRIGVFYPLQTFTKDREIDFQSVPLCIEASKREDLELLKKLASAVSTSVHEVNSEQRKSLHLAAVFVNNFTNHIYQIGNEICTQNELSFDILKPLIAETAHKISALAPIDAQTGPAKREDRKTISKQLDQLENENHKEIYKTLTASILNTYGKKL